VAISGGRFPLSRGEARLHGVTRRPRPSALPSLARFFERLLDEDLAVGFCLPGGRPLFKSGESSDNLYYLRAGRLAARVGEFHPRLVTIRAGETVGEMAALAGVAHSTTVFALRDSELICAPRSVFFDQVRTDPDLLIDLSRLVLARSRETIRDEPPIIRHVFAIIAISPAVKAYVVADRLNEALKRMGHSSVALAADSGPATPEWFSRIESQSEFVLYSVESDETGWGALVGRQVDGVIHVARGADSPGDRLAPASTSGLSVAGDLILLQVPTATSPSGSEAWTAALSPARLFHLRQWNQSDVDRLARTLAGRSVGLVLSGGAARAYAHVGAIEALQEAGAPIDFIGGVSMGAIIGAGVAMGWDLAELDARLRKAFVGSSPLRDITLPFVSFARGDLVRQRLAEHFGDRTIGDLWLPFFCVSSNLTTGVQQIFRQGRVREALLASLSLPGVLPPVTLGDDVLVDGAVLNNFPVDIMRSAHNGPIVGVDVGRGRSLLSTDVSGPISAVRWLTSGAWRRGAPIISLLIRSATVTTGQQMLAAHELTDLLIQPELDHIEIGDWKAYEPAVEEGRRATRAALAGLKAPLTELRHSLSRLS
jgi:NTE family protein